MCLRLLRVATSQDEPSKYFRTLTEVVGDCVNRTVTLLPARPLMTHRREQKRLGVSWRADETECRTIAWMQRRV